MSSQPLISLDVITPSDREVFEAMAQIHFCELDPNFIPLPEWRLQYFLRIQKNAAMRLRWIMVGDKRVGFALYGVESHRFLPREFGMIYEIFIVPEDRQKGYGRAAARHVIDELNSIGLARIQLEVATGNSRAAEWWKRLDFLPVATRFVLKKS